MKKEQTADEITLNTVVWVSILLLLVKANKMSPNAFDYK